MSRDGREQRGVGEASRYEYARPPAMRMSKMLTRLLEPMPAMMRSRPMVSRENMLEDSWLSWIARETSAGERMSWSLWGGLECGFPAEKYVDLEFTKIWA